MTVYYDEDKKEDLIWTIASWTSGKESLLLCHVYIDQSLTITKCYLILMRHISNSVHEKSMNHFTDVNKCNQDADASKDEHGCGACTMS